MSMASPFSRASAEACQRPACRATRPAVMLARARASGVPMRSAREVVRDWRRCTLAAALHALGAVHGRGPDPAGCAGGLPMSRARRSCRAVRLAARKRS